MRPEIDAVEALAAVRGFAAAAAEFHAELIERGFTREEALELTRELVNELLRSSLQPPPSQKLG